MNSDNLSKGQKLALYGLCIQLVAPPINYILNEIIQLGFNKGSISPIVYALLAFVGLYSYKYLKFVSSGVKITVIFIYLLTIISYWLYRNIKEVFLTPDLNPLNSALLFLPLYAFPALIYSNYCAPFASMLIQKVRLLSLFWIALGIYDYLFVILNGHFFDTNYMSFSYSLVPAVCFSAVIGFRDKKYLDIILSIIGLIIILVAGSRGCLLCGLSLYALLFVKLYGFNIKKMLVFIIVISVLFLLIGIYSDSFIDSVNILMDEHGAYSRTLSKFDDGSIGESSMRDAIYKTMQKAILDNPLGYGLYGDRYIISTLRNEGYAHSFIWESLIDFGLIGGCAFIIFIFRRIIICLKHNFNTDIYDFLIVCVALGIIKLLMSGSYLEEIFFFATLGIILNKSVYVRKK